MRNFFASLRRMLAYVDLEKMNLGVIVHQFIKDEAIPHVQDLLKKASTDTERDRLTRLISEYQKYADSRTPESKIFGRTAANIVRTNAQRSRMGDEQMEDLMQSLAVDFFKPLRSGGNDLREALSRVDVTGGPLALNKWWMHIVDLRVKYYVREIKRKMQEHTVEMKETDDGEEIDPMANIPAQSEVSESRVVEVMSDLAEYIHSKLRNPKFVEMFDVWYEVAQEKGADRVDMKHDVYPILRDKGYVGNDSSMTEQWIGIKRIILEFFQKELGSHMAPQVKRLLHLSSVEVLTSEAYRRQLAAWILGGVLRGTIEAGDRE